MRPRGAALALALVCGCKRGCRDEDARTLSPPPTDAGVAGERATGREGDGGSEWDGATGATAGEAAAAALGTVGSAGDAPFRELDADGDGRGDALFELSDGCVLARRVERGWIAEVLQIEGATGPGRCAEPTRLGAGFLMTSSAEGHEVINDGPRTTSMSWTNLALFVAGSGQRVRRVYETRIEEDSPERGDWTYEPGPDDTVMVLHHFERPAATDGDTSVGYMLMRWSTAHDALSQASCWQSVRPVAPRGAIPGCTGRPGAAFHLRTFDSANRDGPERAAGVELRVVGSDAVTRGVTRLYCVLTPDGAYGHVFLAETELCGCRSLVP